MKARVFVSLKETVLDPQGKTICSALQGLGYREITAVRQGKCFDIEIDAAADPGHAMSRLEEAAREVLSNPVIEEFRVELVEKA
jgi:phosphoribosylformylglycinamidine synthase